MTTPLRDGTEFSISAPTLFATAPQIMALSDGRFVAAWIDDGVQMQFFAADGSPVGPVIQPFSDPEMAGLHLSLTQLSDGRIVLVTDGDADGVGSGRDIYGQIVQTDGTVNSPSFLIGESSSHTQSDPKVVSRVDGGFSVIWEDSQNFDDDEFDVVLREFDADGQPIAGNSAVPEDQEDYQTDPVATRLANGGLFTIWTENSDDTGDGDGSAVLGRIIGPDGIAAGDAFQINTTGTDNQFHADAVTLANGNVVVTWTDGSEQRGGDTETDIVAQLFTAEGEKIGGEILVNPAFAGQQERSAIAALPDGGFVIAWRDRETAEDDDSGSAIRAQVFNADGSPRGEVFLVNTLTEGQQYTVDIAALSDGRFVISWNSNPPGMGNEVRAQIFDPRQMPIEQTAGNGGEHLFGGAGDDVLTGGAGNDTLTSGGGYDTLAGGMGNDAYVVNGNDSRIIELDGEGTDRVYVTGERYVLDQGIERAYVENDDGASVSGNAAGNRITGGAGADGLNGEDGNDSLYGMGGDDTLIGGAGHDILDGGEGTNRLVGGLGNDVYVVNFDGSSIAEQAGQGRDAVLTILDSFVLGSNVEDLAYRGAADFNGTGNDLRNILIGGNGNDLLKGLAGADRLEGGAGADNLSGGAGRDVLIGGAGADELTGGQGADLFVFANAEEADGDVIADFGTGQDVIDLSEFMGGGRFIGSRDFSGRRAEVSFDKATGILAGDVDGDGQADWALTLLVADDIVASDFLFN